jgi:Domain of unknown function (DUF4438)
MSDNRSQLVGVAVQGSIASPQCPPLPASPYIIGADGTPTLLPPPGGIVYNVAIGDPAFGWVADMVQPGVSIAAPAGANAALRGLACIGNEAIVVSGRAHGERGTVTGKSGRFADHVIIHFDASVLESLALGDDVLVRAIGRGLALSDAAEVQLKSISPVLLDALEVESSESAEVVVPVMAEVPAVLMGAGSGLTSEAGCVQIQTDDPVAISKHGLDGLRLGDVVALKDFDCRWGNGFVEGATTIGIVVHGDSVRGGHGPGVTPVMTAVGGRIRSQLAADRNIADLLGLRTGVDAPA